MCGARRQRSLRCRTITEVEGCREAAGFVLPIAARCRAQGLVEVDLGAASAHESPAAAEVAEVLGLDQHQVLVARQEEIDLCRMPRAVHFGECLIQVRQPLASQIVAPEVRMQRLVLVFDGRSSPQGWQAEQLAERKARSSQRIDQVPQQGVLRGGTAQIIEHGFGQDSKDGLHRPIEDAGSRSCGSGHGVLGLLHRNRESAACHTGRSGLTFRKCTAPRQRNPNRDRPHPLPTHTLHIDTQPTARYHRRMPHQLWRRFSRAFELGATLAVVAVLAGGATWFPRSIPDRAAFLVADDQFDFSRWTLDALGLKFAQAALAPQEYLPASARTQLVEEYIALEGQAEQLQEAVSKVFADPQVPDPMAASLATRERLAQARARQTALRPHVEAILEEQAGALIAEEGFAFGGQVLPPVSFHFSAIPLALILSPRQVIRQEASIQMNPDLPLEQQIALEQKVEPRLDLSALVVPLGGIGTYPTMIQDTTSLNWIVETIAHEWTHNYLSFRPLGANYDTTPETRTMNETVASIVGRELGARVIARFYPDRVPPPPPPASPGSAPPPVPAFDFRAAMRETRVTVDALLQEGRVSQAESYMEERRRLFVEHGYTIRRLNQAYFAFYGAYADQPGERGADPVGPAVEQLRALSPTVGEFLRLAGGMSSFAELREQLSREHASAP